MPECTYVYITSVSSKDSKCLGTVWYNYDALLRLDDYRAPFYVAQYHMHCFGVHVRSLEKKAPPHHSWTASCSATCSIATTYTITGDILHVAELDAVQLLRSWSTLRKLFCYLLECWLPGSSLYIVQFKQSCTRGTVGLLMQFVVI